MCVIINIKYSVIKCTNVTNRMSPYNNHMVIYGVTKGLNAKVMREFSINVNFL